MQEIPILKRPDPNRTGVIAVRDDGAGKIVLALIYDPPLKDEEELTPAQAFAGHAFSFVKDLFDNMKKQEMDVADLPTVGAALDSYAEAAARAHANQQLNAGKLKLTQTPQQRFKVPSIVPGEVGDIKQLDQERKK